TPGDTSVVGSKHVAFIVVVESPARSVDDLRIRGIEHDMVDDQVITLSEVGEGSPCISPVVGDKYLGRAGSEEQVARVAGIVCQTPDISSIRADETPVGSRGTLGAN